MNPTEIDEMASMNAGSSTAPQTTAGEAKSDRPEGMSKNAMKRAAKQAKMAELKPLKRAAEKERRRKRTAELCEGYAQGTLSETDKELIERRKRIERERRAAQKKVELGDQTDDWKGGVVLDLGFDELMTDQEIASMAQQLGYTYGSNRTAKTPIRTILHTNFSPLASPRLWGRLENFNWKKWGRSYWWHEGLDALKSQLEQPVAESPEGSKAISKEKETEAMDDLMAHITGPNLPDGLQAGNHKLVYLSADAEEELTTLQEDEVYIIGGIVDRNRYPKLCQNKAEKLGIRTARLPIGTYLANMPTRKVLTVNQVFAIVVEYLALKDWAAAFEAVIPQRKYVTGYRKAKKAARLAGGEGEGDVEVGVESEDVCDTLLED